MVLTRRQNTAQNNFEDVKQTQKRNDFGFDKKSSNRKLAKVDFHTISTATKKYFKVFAYPIECIVCAVALFCLVLILSPLLIVFNILKFMEKRWRSDSIAMTGKDALWLQDDKDNRLIINSAMVVECSDIEHLVNTVKEIVAKCFILKDEKGELRYHRLTCCIHGGVFQYFLKKAENFNVDEHVFAYEGEVPKSQHEMEALFSKLCAEDISFDKPPWQFIIIPKTYNCNEAILLFRIHHGMADGVSLAKFLLEAFPDEKLPEKKLLKFANVNRNWMFLNALLSGARTVVKKLFVTPDSSIIHGHSLKGFKKVSWSQPISLEAVKQIKNATGTTVNDVLMACVSMSFHDYFKAQGVSSPPDVTAFVPVDVRPSGKRLELENNFAVVSLPLPVHKEHLVESLHATKEKMDSVKHSGEAFVLSVSGNLTVDYFPDSITTFLNVLIANKHSLVLSNVPGPQQSFSVGGHKVTEIFFTPPQRNLLGIGVGLFSYAGKFSIAVQADLSCMTDPKCIVDAFEARLKQLEKHVVASIGQFDSGIE